MTAYEELDKALRQWLDREQYARIQILMEKTLAKMIQAHDSDEVARLRFAINKVLSRCHCEEGSCNTCKTLNV